MRAHARARAHLVPQRRAVELRADAIVLLIAVGAAAPGRPDRTPARAERGRQVGRGGAGRADGARARLYDGAGVVAHVPQRLGLNPREEPRHRRRRVPDDVPE
jgi:hypothetical protein